MTFNMSLAALAAIFTLSLHLDTIQSAKDSDSCDLNASTESDPENQLLTISDKSSSGMSSRGKRSRVESSPQNCSTRQLKYLNRIHPIDPEIDSNMEKFLKQSEQELGLKSNDRIYYWENYEMEGTKERREFLCKSAWVSLKPRLKYKKKMTDEMKPDCDGALILGPSSPSSPSGKFLGYFQYLPELEGTSFFADILRCNCAYLSWKKHSKRFGTVQYSKFFFYILKMTENIYYILTRVGGKGSRDLKIVSVVNI